MLLSFLYNKTIIDCNQAQNLGTISKIHVNYKKIDYIETSRNVKIDVKNIYQINDAIMYKSEYRNYPNFKFFRVGGQLVTDDKGKIHGRLVDLMITKDFDIKKIITDNKNLLNVEILSISDDGLVFKRMPKAKKKEVKTDKIEEIILSSNYMLLPDVLKKLTINNDIRNTYISLEIINKLIIDNIKIVELKDFYEEMSIASIIKQVLIGIEETKNIYENICPNKNIEKRLKETVNKIVSRHYAANNIIKKYKYVLCHKKIKKKFFRKILANIEKDIEKMESV